VLQQTAQENQINTDCMTTEPISIQYIGSCTGHTEHNFSQLRTMEWALHEPQTCLKDAVVNMLSKS